jgi:hypothetical protein
MTPELQAISERLEEVEKQVAHLAALLTEQSDTSRTVAARRFVVVDEKEQRRATLESTRAGPYLGLFDSHENLRAGLGVTAATALGHEGPWLQLFGEKGRVVAEVREYQDGPRVALFDANGNTRINLNLSENGSFAYFFGPSGKQHLRLELFSSGQVSMVMQDTSGEPRVLLSAEATTGPILAFMTDNNVAWSAP